jgi:hypothetical protein
MKFVDEFRNADQAHALSAKIASLCEPGRHYKFMEVCGGHTHTIYKHGLEDYLPESVELVHGPGCPVCVIPMGRVDDAMHLAADPEVIMTSFGDMMRVPGSKGSFFDAKAEGTDIRMVYSPLDEDYGIPLRRAPDIRQACAEAYGPGEGPSVASLRSILGLIGAHEWRTRRRQSTRWHTPSKMHIGGFQYPCKNAKFRATFSGVLLKSKGHIISRQTHRLGPLQVFANCVVSFG